MPGDKPKSLFQRLQERRASVSGGDPTGGTSMGARGENQPPVQKETAPMKKKKKKA
jgi:hypothetical protein